MSTPCILRVAPWTERSLTRDIPMWFGRRGERVENTPLETVSINGVTISSVRVALWK